MQNHTHSNQTDTESEQYVISKKHFNAILSNKDEAYKQCYHEAIGIAGLLKGVHEEKLLYKQAFERAKSKSEIQEKELQELKSKQKTSPNVEHIIKKISEKDNFMIKNKDKLIDECYRKNHAARIAELRKQLDLDN